MMVLLPAVKVNPQLSMLFGVARVAALYNLVRRFRIALDAMDEPIEPLTEFS